MASASPEPVAKTHHLRPRESVKRTIPSADASSGGVSRTPSSTPAMLDEEDDELSANTTASHYIGMRLAQGLATKRKNDGLITIYNTPKRRRVCQGESAVITGERGDVSATDERGTEELQDVYCWECHKECVEGALDCVSCPRTFHPMCISSSVASECGLKPSENWTCPVCLTIMKAECADTRSWAMQQLSVDQFCTILGFAQQRMKHPDVKTSEAFHNPVPASLLPDYYNVIFHPMDLSCLDKNIKKRLYASTEAFLEDAKWILHNSIIYHGAASKHTADARLIIKICRHEMAEIELCPDCYVNSCIRTENWFTEPCTAPHCLVWAKLKGFPFWPAKALRISSGNNVDVRFFGAHDRAWIPMGQVYLLSAECPLPVKNTKKFGLDKAVDELNVHIKRLREKFGEFCYAPLKADFKPEHLYFCSILFGKNVASSETAQRLLATAAGRRYRDVSTDLIDDQVNSDRRRRSCSTDGHQSTALDDGPSSDGEVSDRRGANGRRAVGELDTSGGQDNNSTNSKRSSRRRSTGRECDEDETSVVPVQTEDNGRSQSSDPPLRIKLSLNSSSSRSSKRKAAIINAEEPMASGNRARSPACTSPPCSAVTASGAQTSGSPEYTTIRSSGGGSSGRRRATPSNVTNVAVNKEGEATHRKRNLQTVLEKINSNVWQLRGSSPSSNDSPKAAGVQLDRLVNGEVYLHADKAGPSREPVGQSAYATVCDKYLEKINEFVHSAISDLMREIQPAGDTVLPREHPKDKQARAELSFLRAEFSKMQCFYNEAMRAMKATAKVTFTEVQQLLESDKAKTVEDLVRKFEEEKKQAIADTKTKQWCANCGKEAVFYCCWNTSYCDYPCQQTHWPKHQASCAQIRQQPADAGAQASPVVCQSYVSAVQYVGGSPLNTSQLRAVPQSSPNMVPLYASNLQNATVFRTSGLPTTAGQPAITRQVAALVRKS